MKILLIIILIIIILIIAIFLKNNYNNFTSTTNNSLHKYFDKIYIITLPERKESMEKLMNKYKINPIYFPAILKKNIDYQELINNGFLEKSYYKEKNHGRIACHYSHISVLKEFLKSNAKTCLIFEDDNEIDVSYEEFNKIIDNSMKIMPKD